MSRLRLLLALLSALIAPGVGIGLTSNALEGVRLYLCFRLFFGIFVPLYEKPVLAPLPTWIVNLVVFPIIWAMWAIIDILNVIHRYRTGAVLPEVQQSVPISLRWLALVFTLLGLFFAVTNITGNYTIGLPVLWPIYWVGPIYIIIGDRLLRGRPGWRKFTIITLACVLAFAALVIIFLKLGYVKYSNPASIPLFWGNTLFAIAALVVLFLPSTRALFRQNNAQVST